MPMEFKKIFRLLIEFFEKEQVQYALVGAFALMAYGYARATQDVDFIMRLTDRDKVIQFLENFGYETIYKSTGYSNHIHKMPQLGRIDFIYIKGRTADLVFSNVKRLLILDDISVPVVSPQHLIALKVFAMKNNPDRVFNEIADIKRLVQLTGIKPNEVKGYFEKYGQLERYYEIFDE